MQPIFLASVTPYVGKNVVALGLAEKFRREKKSVGFFKPIGPLPVHEAGRVVDEDAVFFRKVLGLRPTDGPAAILDARCREFLLQPPAADWDGVYAAPEK